MKISPVMERSEVFLQVIFLTSALGILFVQGYSSCSNPLVPRGTSYNTSEGKLLELSCPINQCSERPNMTWCKINGANCFPLQYGLQRHISWKEQEKSFVFILHFNPVLLSDNGFYRCVAESSRGISNSHQISVFVMNTTDTPLEPRLEEETRQWLLYILLPLGLLGILILTCLSLYSCLRKNQGKEKNQPDTLERGNNQVAPQQPLGENQAEGELINNYTLHRPVPLSSETRIYNNDAWPKVQVGPQVIYSNQDIEENQPGIVYASLNHSAKEENFLRRVGHMTEKPTEYASICVRN